MTVLEKAALTGIMPVINIPNPGLAVPLADALTAGGLPQIEVTLRNDTALDSIRVIKRERPDFVCGAGTVLSVSQAEEALAAGADFIVAPGFNPKVVEHCLSRGAEVLPGCVTPAEIEAGMALGLTTFKFFPSESLGGVRTIKELCGPYRNIRFVPTSGITMETNRRTSPQPSISAASSSSLGTATMNCRMRKMPKAPTIGRISAA